jgi:heat shock protein HslJ
LVTDSTLSCRIGFEIMSAELVHGSYRLDWEGRVTISRSVFNVVVPGLVALIAAAIVPSVVSAASCRDGNLLLASPEVQGTLSLADVKGVIWRLSRLGRNERVPEGVKVTAVFEDGRVSGTGGCNRYSAVVVETDPGGFSIGPAASTRMACPDPAGEFEDRYFHALQTANRFGFLLGNLVLHYGKEDARETMMFEREVPR